MRLRVFQGLVQARSLCLPMIALLAAFSAVGCQAPLKHYALHGRVISKSAETQQVTVDHDEIPGFMPAMAMPYPVKDLQGLNDVQPGDVINADVVARNQADYWLEHIEITDKSGRGKEVVTAPHELAIGEKVPDVSLTNEDGAKLTLSKFKGKSVLVTFVYTRCPLPTFCPLISSEFAAIHKELGASPQAKAKTHLISITLDPTLRHAPCAAQVRLGVSAGRRQRLSGLGLRAHFPGGFADSGDRLRTRVLPARESDLPLHEHRFAGARWHRGRNMAGKCLENRRRSDRDSKNGRLATIMTTTTGGKR
jgi:Cu/Ag efflux protein CusF